jgi:hypothetical protein
VVIKTLDPDPDSLEMLDPDPEEREQRTNKVALKPWTRIVAKDVPLLRIRGKKRIC